MATMNELSVPQKISKMKACISGDEMQRRAKDLQLRLKSRKFRFILFKFYHFSVLCTSVSR